MRECNNIGWVEKLAGRGFNSHSRLHCFLNSRELNSLTF